jgi:hypothetical protein
MIDAVVGSAIALASGTMLVLAIQLSQKALTHGAAYPLTSIEIQTIKNAGFVDSKYFKMIEGDVQAAF